MNDNQTWQLIHGDALKVLGSFAPNTFDAVITDPPYASGGRTHKRRRTGLRPGSIPAWERTHRRPSRATPKINAPGPAGWQSGCMKPEKYASPVRRCVCSSIGGNSPQPQMLCNGPDGSGVERQSGTRETAVPRKGGSVSRRNISSGVPTGICPSAARCPVCRVCSSMETRSAAST